MKFYFEKKNLAHFRTFHENFQKSENFHFFEENFFSSKKTRILKKIYKLFFFKVKFRHEKKYFFLNFFVSSKFDNYLPDATNQSFWECLWVKWHPENGSDLLKNDSKIPKFIRPYHRRYRLSNGVFDQIQTTYATLEPPSSALPNFQLILSDTQSNYILITRFMGFSELWRPIDSIFNSSKNFAIFFFPSDFS